MCEATEVKQLSQACTGLQDEHANGSLLASNGFQLDFIITIIWITIKDSIKNLWLIYQSASILTYLEYQYFTLL